MTASAPSLRERMLALPRRAYWNLRLFGLPRPVRDLWLVVVTGLVAWSLTAQQDQIGGLCQVRVAQRKALEQQWANTQTYLKSPAGKAANGLNDFVRRISVPQLKERLRTETVPSSCPRK